MGRGVRGCQRAGPHRLALSDLAAQGPCGPDPPGGRGHRTGAESGGGSGGRAGDPDLVRGRCDQRIQAGHAAGRSGLVRRASADDLGLWQVEDPGGTDRLGTGQDPASEADHDQPRFRAGPAFGRAVRILDRVCRAAAERPRPDAAAVRAAGRRCPRRGRDASAGADAAGNGGAAVHRVGGVDGDGGHGPHAEGGLPHAADPDARGAAIPGPGPVPVRPRHPGDPAPAGSS